MKTLLKYLTALLLLICAIGSMAYGTLGIIGAIFMLLAILICLPQTFNFIQKKIKVPIMTPMKYIAVIVFSIIGFSLMASTDEFAKFQKENDAKISEKKKEEEKTSSDSKPEVEKVLSPIEAEKHEIEEQIVLRDSNTIKSEVIVYNYIKNEVRADEIFKDKEFFVTGKVENLGKDMMGNIYVSLESNDPIRKTQCFTDDADFVAKLNKGDKVTFLGTCDGLMMNVIMKKCEPKENIESLKSRLKKLK